MPAATPANALSAPGRFHAWTNKAVRALLTRKDANSLATAGALEFYDSSMHAAAAAPPAPTAAAPPALQLLAEAGELAPQSAAIAWMHLQLCAAAPACNSREVATVLRWVDPDNSAAWMSELADAHKEKDSVEIDRVLADMARGTRFDLYRNEIVMMMFDALSGIRRQVASSFDGSDLAKLITVVAVTDAEITPPLPPLFDVCREPNTGSERRQDCLKLAKIMQRSDTVIMQLAGFTLEKRMLPAEGKEARSLAERRHLLEWRTAQASNLDYSIVPWTQKARTRARIAQMRLRPREEDVYIALLRQRKLATEPRDPP